MGERREEKLMEREIQERQEETEEKSACWGSGVDRTSFIFSLPNHLPTYVLRRSVSNARLWPTGPLVQSAVESHPISLSGDP